MFGLLLGGLVVACQVARFGAAMAHDVRPWDDVIAGGLLLGASAARAMRPVWLAVAWALFTGVHLTTLVINLHAWMGGAKAGGAAYAAALAVLTLVRAAATLAAARRA